MTPRGKFLHPEVWDPSPNRTYNVPYANEDIPSWLHSHRPQTPFHFLPLCTWWENTALPSKYFLLPLRPLIFHTPRSGAYCPHDPEAPRSDTHLPRYRYPQTPTKAHPLPAFYLSPETLFHTQSRSPSALTLSVHCPYNTDPASFQAQEVYYTQNPVPVPASIPAEYCKHSHPIFSTATVRLNLSSPYHNPLVSLYSSFGITHDSPRFDYFCPFNASASIFPSA